MTREEIEKEIDRLIDNEMLKTVYDLAYDFQPFMLKWMDIEDGKNVKKKISVCERFLKGEHVSEEELDEVLDPKRNDPNIDW